LLGKIFKALKVDLQNYEDAVYKRSSVSLQQLLQRLLSMRKHYPEYQQKESHLIDLRRGSRREGLGYNYWQGSNVSVGTDNYSFYQLGILGTHNNARKYRLLDRYIRQASDSILMKKLSVLAELRPQQKEPERIGSQSHRLQVRSLLYQLHLLDAQLQSMIDKIKKRHSAPNDTPLPQITEPVDLWYGLAENPQTP
jgi:hypothetical protein